MFELSCTVHVSLQQQKTLSVSCRNNSLVVVNKGPNQLVGAPTNWG
jgi:hypothetical protein